jgi:TusA-related sulfurtransferase
MTTRNELNLTGLKCPLPIVELNRAIKQMSPGEELQVIANDPAFPLDVEAWCRRTSQLLLSLQEQDGRYHARLRKVR